MNLTPSQLTTLRSAIIADVNLATAVRLGVRRLLLTI